MQHDHLNDLVAWGLLQPKVDQGRSVAALRAVGPAAAADVVHRQKVAHIARARIAELTADGHPEADLLAEFDAEIANRRAPLEQRFANADRVLGALADALPELPVRLMKGLAARDWYPANRRRDVGDADLWAADIDAGWQLAGVLRDLGHDYESAELPWVKRDPMGRLYGQIRMLDRQRRSISVDIHIGPYSVRYCGMLHFGYSLGPAPWQPLAHEDNLCAVIVNAAGDCFIDAKTVNDCVVCLAAPIDLAYVADRIAQCELSGFLAALLNVIEDTCALEPDQALRLRELYPDAPPEQVGIATAPDPAVRLEVVVAHAYRAALRLTASPEDADRVAAYAHHAYSDAKSYRLIADRPGRGDLPWLTPWTCVRLAPQPLLRGLFRRDADQVFQADQRVALSGELELLHGASGDLVRFRGDTFVPTVDYAFPVGLVDNLAPPA